MFFFVVATFSFVLTDVFGSAYGRQHFSVIPVNRTTIKGRQSHFFCVVENSRGETVWVRNGVILKEVHNGRRFIGFPRWHSHGDIRKGVYNIIIDRTKKSDEGEYECRVIDSTGHAILRAKAYLTVVDNTAAKEPVTVFSSATSPATTIDYSFHIRFLTSLQPARTPDSKIDNNALQTGLSSANNASQYWKTHFKDVSQFKTKFLYTSQATNQAFLDMPTTTANVNEENILGSANFGLHDLSSAPTTVYLQDGDAYENNTSIIAQISIVFFVLSMFILLPLFVFFLKTEKGCQYHKF